MTQAQTSAELTQAYAAGAMSFRNRLINGAPQVTQRGNGPFTTQAVGIDRWVGVVTAPNTISHQFAVEVQSNAFMRYSWANGGAAGASGLWQNTEFPIWASGQLVTISYDARTSNAVSMASYIDVDYNSSDGAVVLQGIKVQALPGDGAWHRYTNTVQVNSFVGKNIGYSAFIRCAFAFDNSTVTGLPRQASGTIDLRRIQMELGPIATPFEDRPYGLELMLCQRHYWRRVAAGAGEGFGGSAFAYGVSNVHAEIRFPVPMRVTPNMNAQNIGCNSSGGGPIQANTFTANGPSPEVAAFNLQMAVSNLVGGQATNVIAMAAGSWIDASAEL